MFHCKVMNSLYTPAYSETQTPSALHPVVGHQLHFSWIWCHLQHFLFPLVFAHILLFSLLPAKHTLTRTLQSCCVSDSRPSLLLHANSHVTVALGCTLSLSLSYTVNYTGTHSGNGGVELWGLECNLQPRSNLRTREMEVGDGHIL